MDDRTVWVRPVAGGWSVDCALNGGQPLMFLSGARAEEHARTLAGRLAVAGDEVRLVVEDRTSRVIGVLHYQPPAGA